VLGLNRHVRLGGHDMVLLSLESWTTSFTIHWFFAAEHHSSDVDLALREGLRRDVSDGDAGTEDRGGDFGAGGGNSASWRRTSYFAPSIRNDASRLRIRVGDPTGGAWPR
jgi:hypothetical protein